MKRLLCSVLVALGLFASGNADATRYFVRPPTAENGVSDANSGWYISDAWATLPGTNTVRSRTLLAGDTLFVMGGIYEARNYWRYMPSGVTVKAWGDSIAVFRLKDVDNNGNEVGYNRDPDSRYFGAYNGRSNIVIDGYGAGLVDGTTTDSLMIKLELYERGDAIGFWNCTDITVKGIEVDGQFDPIFRGDTLGGAYLEQERVSQALYFYQSQRCTIQDNYIRNIHVPTGPIAPGVNLKIGLERAIYQSTGYGIFLSDCNFMYIEGNRIETCNHGAIELNPCSYSKVIDNTITQGWGGGIYVVINANHNLIESNVISHCGETTTFGKPGIQISGSNNTVRKNVFYNPVNEPIRLEAQFLNPAWGGYVADGNLIYNNTVREGLYSIGGLVNNDSWALCSIENNLIFNNLFHSNSTLSSSGAGRAVMQFDLWKANMEHNWCNPDINLCLPDGTNWGGNTFFHNLLLRTYEGNDVGRVFSWARDNHCGGDWVFFNYSTLHSSPNSAAWQNNIAIDPMFVDDPDSIDVWWSIENDSPCINAGIGVDDHIGAQVETDYPGYGWGALSYVGDAPDIGAYEYVVQDTVGPPYLVIEPGAWFYFGSVAYGDTRDVTIWAKNDCLEPCEDALIAPVITSDSSLHVFSLESSEADTLAAGDSVSITVRFTPTDQDSLHIGKLVAYSGAQYEIPIVGIGKSGATAQCAINYSSPWYGPTDIDYGAVPVFTTIRDTIVVQNWGTTTLEATVALKNGFEIQIESGGGAISLAPGASDSTIVTITPSGAYTFSDSLTVSSAACPGIILKCTGYLSGGKSTPTRPVRE